MRFLFSIYEGLKIALWAIWQNKIRAFLTTFGIVIGILSVTTMATVIDGIDRSFQSSMDMLGKDVLYVQKWPWSFGPNYKWWEYRNRREMKAEYAEQVDEYSQLASSVSALTGRNSTVRYKDDYLSGVELRGVNYSYAETSSLNLDDGRFFTEEEERLLRNVCIIGANIADELFPYSYPIGKEIKVQGQKFEVIGIMEKRGKFLGLQDMDNQLIIPFSTYEKFYGARYNVSLMVKYDNAALLEEGQYELEGVMRRIRGLDPMEDNDFAVNKMELFEQQYKSMTGAIYAVGIFLTALALFVGGIGVMNIMFVSVKERTKEIGIRKAIGAKSYEILTQFLIEAVIVCSLGGVVGVVLSLGAAELINQVFVAHMDWGTVIQAFLICALTGVTFGFMPAWKAAKADPISSLRYD
jgi:putative ABC transport system permease protein